MNLELLTKQVCAIAKEAGISIKKELANIKSADVKSKGLHDFVTYVDKNSEQFIVSELLKLTPDAGILAEEDTSNREAVALRWIIDPLDGTTNFIHGVPCFSISIALQQNDKTIIGVVYDVNLEECFYSWEGKEAYLNGKVISVSDTESIADSLLATGFPYHDFSRMEQYIALFRLFMKESHGVRRLGSAAIDLAWVACGRFDGFFEYGLRPWDVAAGAFLIEQAGGKVCDFNKGNDYVFGQGIIGSNNKIFEKFSTVVGDYLRQESKKE